MKNKLLLSTILFTICIATASAQTNKGVFFIGGNLSYNYNSYGSEQTYNYANGYTNYYLTKISTFSISPEFGYFLSKKWSVSIQPTFVRDAGTESNYFYSYVNTASNYVSSDTYHTSEIGASINVRYYCMFTDKIGFFPQLGIGTLNNSAYLKYGSFNLSATPNFVFFATPHLAVNLGFGNVSYALDYQTKDRTINAGLNNDITFGLNYYWGKK